MGYYVTLTGADFRIPKSKWNDAFLATAELNRHDELKTGGSWSKGKQQAVWFAWMPEDYPKDAVQAAKDGEVEHPLIFVFEHLGFGCCVLDDYLYLENYDSKIGAEDHFLAAVAPFVTPDSFLEWTGEDGEMWRNEFDGVEMTTRMGRVVFE